MENQNQNKNEHWKVLVLQIKKTAENKKITHQQIADICGFHRSNVTRMFRLSYCPSLENFLKVAQAVNVKFTIKTQ